MKKSIKIACMAISLFFLLVGVSNAYILYDPSDPANYDPTKNLQSQLLEDTGTNFLFQMGQNPWAVLNVHLDILEDHNTYTFQLHVQPDMLEVSTLWLPVGSYSNLRTAVGNTLPPIKFWGDYVAIYNPGKINEEVVHYGPMLEIKFWESSQEIFPGESSIPIIMDSGLFPTTGIALIIDGSALTEGTVAAALAITDQGPGGGLPEPMTLILLGIGILGTGFYRRLSSKRGLPS